MGTYKIAINYCICLLLISLPICSAAQNLNWYYSMKGESQKKIGDKLNQKSVAYSLRKVNVKYNGAGIKVRRSSDNNTLDIGFLSDGSLDTASLKSFVGSSSGYVSVWYDQAGYNNSKNATQGNNSFQPRIVNLGAIERLNGKPALRFISSSPTYFNDSLNSNYAGITINLVHAWNSGEASFSTLIATDGAYSGNALHFIRSSSSDQYQYSQPGYPDYGGSAYNAGTVNVVSINGGGSLAGYVNSVSSFSGNTGNINLSAFKIGVWSNDLTRAYNGWISEIFIFDSKVNGSLRAGLESDQYRYFRIPVSAPGAPVNVNASTGSSVGQININWGLPEVDGGGDIFDYLIEYKLSSASNWSVYNDGISNLTSQLISGLQNSSSYDFRVSAANAKGTGVASSVFSATTPTSYSVSGPSYGLINTGSGLFTITPGSPINGTITVTPSGGGLSSPIVLNFVNSAAAQTFQITPSSAGTVTLSFSSTGFINTPQRLYTSSNFGTSDAVLNQINATASSSFALRPQRASFVGPVMQVLNISNNAKASITCDSSGNISSQSIATITVPGSSGYATGQTILFKNFYNGANVSVETWYDQSGNGNHASQSTIANQPIIVSAGILKTMNGKAAIFFNGSHWLETVNGAITQGSLGFTINAVMQSTTTSGIQRIFDQGVSSNISNGRASLTSNGGGLYFSGENNDYMYGLSWGTVPSTGTIVVNAPGSTGYINGSSSVSSSLPNSSLNIANIKSVIGRKNTSTEYVFGYITEVSVFNSSLNSSDVQALSANQSNYYQISVAVPNAPTGLTASTGANAGQIDLSWNAPITNGGGYITGYTIEYKQSGSPNWQTYGTTPTNTYLTVLGLSGSTSYDFRVSATNSKGTGTASSIASAFTPISYTVAGPTYGLVNTISNIFTITPSTAITGTITINPSGGGLSTPIVLSFSNSSAPQSFQITPSSAGTVSLAFSSTGFANPQTYLYTSSTYGSANTILNQLSVNAASAYSVRPLKSTYLGPIIQVLNTSNNAKATITCDSSGSISNRSIASITVAGTSGYSVGQTVMFGSFYTGATVNAETLYDQSGNANNASQTTLANQPVIVNAGNLFAVNGRGCMYFSGSQWMETNNGAITPGSQNFSINSVINFISNSGIQRVFDQGASTSISNGRASLAFGSGNMFFSGESNDFNYGLNPGINVASATIVVNTPGSKGYLNSGTAVTSSSIPNTSLNVANIKNVIGRKNNPGEYINGYLFEITTFNSALGLSDVNILRNDQINFYLIH